MTPLDIDADADLDVTEKPGSVGSDMEEPHLGYFPRIVAGAPAGRPLYVTTQGAVVGKSGERILVSFKDECLASVRMEDTSQVCVYGGVSLSSALIGALLDHGIPILHFSQTGWFKGITSGLASSNIILRQAQFERLKLGDLDAACVTVSSKIKNSRTLLRRNARADVGTALSSLASASSAARLADSSESLLGIEGAAARVYFSHFALLLAQSSARHFQFMERNRRPPRDPINSLLSYLYGILTKDMIVASSSVGLDPYLGFYHRPRHGSPALALDLIEELRPILADSVAMSLINRREVSVDDFVVTPTGVSISHAAKKAVIHAYERRLEQTVKHPVVGYEITYRRLFEIQARIFAAYLMGEVCSYVPFEVR
ncbi:MAG: CRISPR-associated endonuclease Cas1 [Actinobacteria bacterium]|nr:CRISPR-associated endonuclease Cas1 [Actinomycetota bacterium]